jgi:hypothetical protein
MLLVAGLDSTALNLSPPSLAFEEGVVKATARRDFAPAMLLVHLRFSARTHAARYAFTTPS